MFRKIIFIATLFTFLFIVSGLAQQTIIKYLSGTGNDHTVTWDFYCTGGRNSGKWTTIQVPSCWELQGFGTYNYGYDKNPGDEVGIYKYHFKADKAWEHKQVNIVFEGSMTDTKVAVNGKIAGQIHQGAFYQFKYNITPLLKFGKTNLLEVWVNKRSANASVNAAERSGDFWIFGGIFRPVYLQIVPVTHIQRVAINAQANGHFNMQVFLRNVNKDYNLEADIEKVNGSQKLQSISIPVAAHDTMVTMQEQYQHVDLWSPEFPHLYRVRVYLKNNKGEVMHVMDQQFGFRTIELRPHDGFYLNGKKILFKGVCHHSFWPSSGRTTSKALAIEDVTLMKEMNMNAVRTSHYPPDIHFLDVCDSMGLMVLDELMGWHHSYDDSTGHKLVKAMVIRDVNHPSVVIWDNGNEGDFNTHLDNDFGLYDPQKRIVIHPWAKFNRVNDTHYPSYNYMENTVLYGNAVYFSTEFLHGLYDGGSGAGLDDYWNLMEHAPHSAGGFLWDFADAGVVRTDENDTIDTHGDFDADGILGPYRQKGGSFYAIKQIWSPVQIAQTYITPQFDGKLLVENRYLFTNLNECTFKWKLVSFGDPYHKKAETKTDATGQPDKVSIEPGETRWMDLRLPSSWSSSDALYLTAWDPHHRKLFTWSWPIHTPAEIAERWMRKTKGAAITATDIENTLMLKDGNVKLYFDKTTGYLEKVVRNDSALSLSGGPVVAGVTLKLDSFTYKADSNNYVVEADYKGEGGNWMKATWTFIPGMPVKLSYSYNQKGEAGFMGITFNYPAKKLTGMQWLGRGPYHVWKNRLKGLKFGVWDNEYDSPKGKDSWVYPELKGNFENVYWAKVATKEIPFTVFVKNRKVFLQMLKPDRKKAPNKHDQTDVVFPQGDIGFMNAIEPTGTKFTKAGVLGPQSQENVQLNAPYEGVVWFDFRGIR